MMGVRKRRASRPVLEHMEPRELLSGLIASMAAEAPSVPSAFGALAHRVSAESGGGGAGGGGGSGHGGGGSGSNGTGGNSAVTGFGGNGNTGGRGNGNGLTNNTASTLLGAGTPTPQELKRETYRSYFSGRYYVGPGRFSDQGTTYYFRGLGGSNFFLHGDFNMAIITPTNPTTPFFGEAILNDKNTNSAGIQGLQLTGSRTSVDSLGRPTQMTFTADPNIYSGVFFVEAAQGTVDITYGPRNAATVRFSGLVYTSGLTSPLVNQDLYARHGRPIPFHPGAAHRP